MPILRWSKQRERDFIQKRGCIGCITKYLKTTNSRFFTCCLLCVLLISNMVWLGWEHAQGCHDSWKMSSTILKLESVCQTVLQNRKYSFQELIVLTYLVPNSSTLRCRGNQIDYKKREDHQTLFLCSATWRGNGNTFLVNVKVIVAWISSKKLKQLLIQKLQNHFVGLTYFLNIEH